MSPKGRVKSDETGENKEESDWGENIDEATASFQDGIRNIVKSVVHIYYLVASIFEKIPQPIITFSVLIIGAIISEEVGSMWESLRATGIDLPTLKSVFGFESETPVTDIIGLTMQQVFAIFFVLYMFDTMLNQMGRQLLERDLRKLEKEIEELQEQIENDN